LLIQTQLALSQWKRKKYNPWYDSITWRLTRKKPEDVDQVLVDTVFDLIVSVLGANSRNGRDIRRWKKPSALRAAIWTLDTTMKQSFHPLGIITNAIEENVFYPDKRALVAPGDFKDGGKYRRESSRFALNAPLD
jgi:hypothetical protein